MSAPKPLKSLSIVKPGATPQLSLCPAPEGVDLSVSEADAIRMRDWLNDLYPPKPAPLGEPVAWILHRQEDGKRRVFDVFKTKGIAEGWKENVTRSRISFLARRPGCSEWVVSGLGFLDAPPPVPNASKD